MPGADHQATLFEPIFLKPSIEAMLTLTPKQFEAFVGYVLGRAGYRVRDTAFKFRYGVDLRLFSAQVQQKWYVGGVEVKRYDPAHPVSSAIIQKLIGAPSIRAGKVPGYVITTSTFTSDARDFAREAKNIYLLDGDQLVRYLNYLRGSVDDQPSSVLTPIAPQSIPNADALLKQTRRIGTKILTIANNKGGVGKTTTARFLAIAFAKKGQRVLLVDTDAQANLSEQILNTRASVVPSPHLADYFAGQVPLAHALHSPVNLSGVAILPGHTRLAKLDSGGSGRPETELKFITDLYEAFASIPAGPHGTFDWIMIDTPPATSLFTRAALAAADYVLIPARARQSSVQGTLNMLAALDAMSALMGRSPRLLGCAITHAGEDQSAREALVALANIMANRGSQILQTAIPVSTAIEMHPNLATTAIDAYARLTEEVQALCQQ